MTALNVRSLDPKVAERIRLAAAGRGMTQAEYVTALQALRDAVAEGRNAKKALTDLGLAPRLV